LSIDPQTYSAPADLLRDRIILVTGASDGIGRALALRAAELGAQLILHGRNVKKLEKVYDEVEALESAPRPSIAVVDLATANSVAYESLAESLAEEFGRLDGLVHNASIIGDRFSIEQYDAVQWQRVLHVNLTSAFALTQVLLPMVKQADDPSIIFTSSSVGRVGRAFWGAYAVSKFGTEGLSQVLADEHREGKLRVNCINPGATRTNMRLDAFPGEDRSLLKGPEEILAPYLYLLGPDSKGVTGQSLNAQ
jgi:NAD(P)-dependent dehydrogenase (short-subunit alcohol dehydrogenase family)